MTNKHSPSKDSISHWRDKFDTLNIALTRLEEALNIINTKPELNSIIMDSCIQRFEFCYELLWKALKKLLSAQEAIEANSPKQVMQEAYKFKIDT